MSKRYLYLVFLLLIVTVTAGIGYHAYDNSKHTTYGDVIFTEFTNRNLNTESVVIFNHFNSKLDGTSLTFKRALIKDEESIENLFSNIFHDSKKMELKRVRNKELDFLVLLDIVTEDGSYHIFLQDGYITTRFSNTKSTSYKVLSGNTLIRIIDQELDFVDWEHISVDR